MSPRSATLEPELAAVFAPTSVGAFPRPQVNLLPPEVRSRRTLGRVKVRLGLAIVGVVVLLSGAYVFSTFEKASAADNLAEKQTEVQRLVTEQAKYAEVPRVKGQIAAVEQARLLGTSTEVLWPTYLRAIQAVAPEGWTLDSLTTLTPTPLTPASPATNPLAAPNVGTLTFTGRAATLPDVAAWLDALDQVPGFSDPYVSSAAITTNEGAAPYYATSATVQVDSTVFAQRFATDEGTK
jgi:Tfp pilus assembly protein PilN